MFTQDPDVPQEEVLCDILCQITSVEKRGLALATLVSVHNVSEDILALSPMKDVLESCRPHCMSVPSYPALRT